MCFVEFKKKIKIETKLDKYICWKYFSILASGRFVSDTFHFCVPVDIDQCFH